MNRRERRARRGTEPNAKKLHALALEAQRRFHALARTLPDLHRVAREEVFFAFAVTNAPTMKLAVLAHARGNDGRRDVSEALHAGIDRAASEGVEYSVALLLEPEDVVAALEVVALAPAVVAGVATWMAKPVPAKMMRMVTVCEAEIGVFYQGDVLRLVENQN